ncbi:MAG: DUF4112 domain-containing protein [Vampirovibrionales bacterium]|nr:DUF4112 domain-containing protein [Vampirovibrionales bacterium]
MFFKKKPKPAKTLPASHPLIEKARQAANYMDAAWTVPIVRKKIGLDPLIGLVPGVGDAISLGMSLYLLWVAYQLNMPGRIYAALLINVGFDFLIGTVPVVGDIADFFWKANLKNLKLLEEAYRLHGDRSHLRTGKPTPNWQSAVIDVTPE